MTAVLVAPSRFSDLPASVRQLVVECARHGPTILATPAPAHAPGESLVEVALKLDRPLELQSGCDWLDTVEDPVLVALGARVEPVVLSRRLPCAWLETDTLPSPVSAAVALAARSDLVVAPALLRRAVAIQSERFLEIRDLDGSELWKELHRMERRSPRDSLHALLAAELFHRHIEALRQYDFLEGIGAYRRAKIGQRLGVVDSEEVVAICGEEGDSVGKAIVSTLDLASSRSSTPGVEASAFTALLLELEIAKDLRQLLAHPRVRAYEFQKPWTRYVILRHVLRLASRSDGLTVEQTSQIRQLLAYPDGVEGLGPDVVAWLGTTGWALPHVFERPEEFAEPFTALSAKVELWRRRHDQGGWVDEKELESALETIDSRSWHVGLWRAALDYWQRITGSTWSLRLTDVAPPAPPHQGEALGPEAIGEVDRNAREALANHEFDRAIELFSRVRSLSLAENPPLITTEMAARLNLGWALWESGRPESEWRPYLTSVLTEVSPGPELVRLRHRTADLLRRVSMEPDRNARYARELDARLEALESLPLGELTARRSVVEKVIEEIDSRASHRSLWVTGLDYWQRITGSTWSLRLTDAAPPAPPHQGEALGPEAIAELNRRAKKALARGWRRRAARLFQRVRSACEAVDPPLRSTERAARLNLGWTYRRLGRPEEIWRPFLTSVLEEVRPPEPFLEVRARATQILERMEGKA